MYLWCKSINTMNSKDIKYWHAIHYASLVILLLIYCEYRSFVENTSVLWGMKPILPGTTIRRKAEIRWEHNAKPRNVLFFGCILSVKVLTVTMLHGWYAEMREAWNLCTCVCEFTTESGFKNSCLVFTNFQENLSGPWT